MRRHPHPRRGQILPASVRSVEERRELLVAFGIVFALQLAIAVALGVSGLKTYRMWRQGVSYLPREIVRTVPVAFAGGAAIALFAALRTMARIRAIAGLPETPPPD